MGSVRRFERELSRHAPDLRGTSRQTLYRYFAGESEPGPGVLDAAAKVLDVRGEWLAAGDGAMTAEEEERARAAREKADAGEVDATEEEPADLFIGVVAERFGDPRVTSDPHTFLAVLEAWDRLAGAGLFPAHHVAPAAGEEDPLPGIRKLVSIEVPRDHEAWARHHAIAVQIGHALAAGMAWLPITPNEIPDDALRDYVTATCQGFHRLASAHGRRSAGGPRLPTEGED